MFANFRAGVATPRGSAFLRGIPDLLDLKQAPAGHGVAPTPKGLQNRRILRNAGRSGSWFPAACATWKRVPAGSENRGSADRLDIAVIELSRTGFDQQAGDRTRCLPPPPAASSWLRCSSRRCCRARSCCRSCGPTGLRTRRACGTSTGYPVRRGRPAVHVGPGPRFDGDQRGGPGRLRAEPLRARCRGRSPRPRLRPERSRPRQPASAAVRGERPDSRSAGIFLPMFTPPRKAGVFVNLLLAPFREWSGSDEGPPRSTRRARSA